MAVAVAAALHAGVSGYLLKDGSADRRQPGNTGRPHVREFGPSRPMGPRRRPPEQGRRAHAPATAVTPSSVPTKAWLPVIDSDAKCGRDVPRLSEYRTAPVAGSSS